MKYGVNELDYLFLLPNIGRSVFSGAAGLEPARLGDEYVGR